MDAERDMIVHLVGVPHMAKPTEGVFPAKGYILIAMLLLAGSGRMSRQAVAALLWDDAPEEKALTNLRQLLVRIHRCWPYEEPLVETSGSHLVAGPSARRSDLATILALQKSAVLAERVQAVLLAKGDLLDTIDTGGGELAQWFRGERERFRRLVLTLGADVLLEMTRFGRAPEREIDIIGERMLALEPEREESFRALIEAYGRNGNIDAVNRTFDALTNMLRREFGSDPRPETLAIIRRIAASIPRPRPELIFSDQDSLQGPPASEVSAVRSLAGLPRVALFPPMTVLGNQLHVLHRALIEDVANNLSRHRTFAVIAPYSSFEVADATEEERATRLKVQYAISGYILPGVDQLALRLTRHPGAEIIWAAEYDVSVQRMPVTFRLVSRQIASTLAQEIERDQLDRVRADPKPMAYRHYLEGQIKLQNFDLARLRKARSDFKQALQIDKSFAPAHARIAQTLYNEWLMLGGTDPYILNQAKAEANSAISIDSGGGMGHWVDAVVALHQRDFDHSMERFREAEALNPHSADMLVLYGDALSHMGEADAGWERFQLSLALNPFPPDFYWWCGATIACRQQNFTTAIDLCKNMSSDESVLRILASCHGLLGNVATAKQYGRRLAEMYPGMTALDMARLAPDKRQEDVAMMERGLRTAGLS
ncbi:SARP family transcriptional regulator [Labrys okinawensis]|uniref:SARP family transcriptional regulator n=2 Tax=Labrys okinawensis TaxID=346911 RepID=A0A2S9QHV0_9HYPH|nr:SARP family transcriptional regulator [Labrys okinawensis]